jgi:uncharacterized protein YjiS (DUF1127 family)
MIDTGWARHGKMRWRMLVALAEFITAWRRYRRDRRLLASLNERELRDIGIDRSMVENDSAVEFWRWR